MPRNSDTFWSRVLFKDFIRHFRKMTPEQVAEDIAASMDALEDLNPDGESFGSLMVRWANERMNGAFATAARENGKKGGRPRKSTADGDTREDSLNVHDGSNAALLESGTSANTTTTPAISTNGPRQAEARQSRRAGGNSLRVAKVSTSPARSSGRISRCPNSREDFHAFVADNKLHEGLAEEWYAMHEARGWVDENGSPIKNWRGALYNYCTKTEQKRRSA